MRRIDRLTGSRMTPESFDGWTSEGLGIALRMTSGDLARNPHRGRWLMVGIGVAVLLGCLVIGGLALIASRWLQARSRD
jgi:hypothetical protein